LNRLRGKDDHADSLIPLGHPQRNEPVTGMEPGTFVDQQSQESPTRLSKKGREVNDSHIGLNVDVPHDDPTTLPEPSPYQVREHATRLEDDLAVLEAERCVSNSQRSEELNDKGPIPRSRSHRSDPADEFGTATNPLHEKTAIFRPPEHPSTNLARLVKRIHNSSFLIRYFTYIVPVVVILLVPLLLGALVFKDATVGEVRLLWFSVWLEIVWLTLWAGRVCISREEQERGRIRQYEAEGSVC
jgi:hypothetical protein